VLGLQISGWGGERSFAAVGRSARGPIEIRSKISCEEISCEEKVTFGLCSVHSPFTPAGFILMAEMQLTLGGKLAPARR
jgi:hypothetical protein